MRKCSYFLVPCSYPILFLAGAAGSSFWLCSIHFSFTKTIGEADICYSTFISLANGSINIAIFDYPFELLQVQYVPDIKPESTLSFHHLFTKSDRHHPYRFCLYNTFYTCSSIETAYFCIPCFS